MIVLAQRQTQQHRTNSSKLNRKDSHVDALVNSSSIVVFVTGEVVVARDRCRGDSQWRAAFTVASSESAIDNATLHGRRRVRCADLAWSVVSREMHRRL
jgi:hypothetical protein